MKYLCLIPARYASTRFPGKPLALLGGQPIIVHVCRRASQVFQHVAVATDDERIAQCVSQGGYHAIMTSAHHPSGTDRCREAAEAWMRQTGEKPDVVVNVQGDEPFIHPDQLETIKSLFTGEEACDIATLVRPWPLGTPMEEVENPSSPKVVVGRSGQALYFSRSVIPWLRGVPRQEWTRRHVFLRHIGLYAYRLDALQRITSLPQGELEQAESLEQLRWLEAGLTIRVGRTQHETIGIDTPQDLLRAQQFLLAHKQ